MKKRVPTLIAILVSVILSAQTNDSTFNPNHSGDYREYMGIHGIVKSDGKILSEYSIGNTSLRLFNSDGSPEVVLHQSTGNIYFKAVSPNGKMLCAFDESNEIRLYLYDSDGTPITNYLYPTVTIDPLSGGGGTSTVPALLQDDGKLVLGGNFLTVNGISSKNIVRLNTDGSVDTSFNVGTGFSSAVSAITQQSDGKYIIGGTFSTFNGVNRKKLVRLNYDGSLDTTFYNFYSSSGLLFINGYIVKIQVQADGKILVCGPNSSLNGVNKGRGVTRLLPNGNLDTSFSFQTEPAYYANDMIILQNGQYLVAKAGSLYRVNSNGSRDYSFNYANPENNGNFFLNEHDLQQFPDGKVLINKSYTSSNGLKRLYMHRMNTDGSIDLTFNPQQSTVDVCKTVKVLQNNKIIISGLTTMTSYNETPCKTFIRLDENGELDNAFNIDSQISASGKLNIKELPDGKLIIGRIWFDNSSTLSITQQSITTNKLLIRVTANGSYDSGFDVSTSGITDYLVLPDGKILITTGDTLKRLNSDGTLDNSFATISNITVNKLTQFEDGSFFMIGKYSSSLTKLYKLNNDGTLNTTFNCPYTTVTAVYRQSNNNYLVLFTAGTQVKIKRVDSLGLEDSSFTEITRPSIGANSNSCSNIFVNSEGKIFANFWLNGGETTIDICGVNGDLEQTVTNPLLYNAVQQSCDRILANFEDFGNSTGDLYLRDLKRYYIYSGSFVPAPIGDSQQTFLIGDTIANLIASGQNIQWYDSQTQCGQNIEQRQNEMNDLPLSMSTPLVNGSTYFASQTIGGIESSYRLPVTANSLLGNIEIKNPIRFINPLNTTLSLESVSPFTKLEIYNIDGKLLITKNTHNTYNLDLDISSLSASIYLAKIYTDMGVYSLKLVKQ